MTNSSVCLCICLMMLMSCKHDAKANRADEDFNHTTQDSLDHNTTSLKFGMYNPYAKNGFNSSDYKNFDIVSYAGYDIDPDTGDAIDTHNWETTSVIDSLQGLGVDLLLLASSTGRSQNRQFLNNSKAVATFTVNASSKLAMQNAKGVHLHLDSIALEDLHKFTNFITMFSNHLHNQGYVVYLTLPNEFPNAFDTEVLNSRVDYYVLMQLSNSNPKDDLKNHYLNRGVPVQKLLVVDALE